MEWERAFKIARKKANEAYENASTPYEAAGAYLRIMEAFNAGNYPEECNCVLPSQSCPTCSAAWAAHGEEIPF